MVQKNPNNPGDKQGDSPGKENQRSSKLKVIGWVAASAI